MNIRQFARKISNDEGFAGHVKANLQEEVLKAAVEQPCLDPWVYRIAVAALGGTIILCVIAGGGLALYSRAVPDLLIAIGSSAVGALAGLFIPTGDGSAT